MNIRLTIVLLFALLYAIGVTAQGIRIPENSPGLMPDPSAGKPLYEKDCASCHGRDLTGSDKGPPFTHRIYETSHHGAIAFQLDAQNGVRAHHRTFGDMKPVPAVTPDDVAHITAYIRMHQRKAGIH